MAQAEAQTKTDKRAATHGRPRLLTHDEIIAGALELGLETLTMKKLALHLGVGTATLYQYWSNRKELVQAAAVRSMSALDWPEDTGQHWSAYATEFALLVSGYLSQSPSLVLSNHAREYGFEVQFRLVEQFLEVMKKRGFGPEEAMKIYNIMGVIAFGGAVEIVRQADFKLYGEEGGETAQAQLSSLDDGELPLLRQALGSFTASPEDKLKSALRSAFIGFAVERGDDPADIVAL